MYLEWVPRKMIAVNAVALPEHVQKRVARRFVQLTACITQLSCCCQDFTVANIHSLAEKISPRSFFAKYPQGNKMGRMTSVEDTQKWTRKKKNGYAAGGAHQLKESCENSGTQRQDRNTGKE